MVGRVLIFLLVALVASCNPAYAVDFTPVAVTALDWTQAALTILVGVMVPFIIGWLRRATGVKNAELEAILAGQMNDILHRGIDLAYTTMKAKVNDPDSPLKKVEFNNIFINMAASYVARSAPEIMAKFGITRDRLEEMIIARLPKYLTEDENLTAPQTDVVIAAAKKQATAS